MGHWETKQDKPENAIGFIYLIVNTINGKRYIGKKNLFFKTSRPPLKGKINKRRGQIESDWETYTGSCKELNKDIETLGKSNFRFIILKWCLTRMDLNYSEIKEMVDANAIFSKDYYNKYLGCRIINNNKI